MARQQFGGFGGGGSNMQQLMRQAQKLKEEMEKTQQELDECEYTAQTGGGMVSVTATGKGKLKEITINPECVDSDDVEMLQDMVLAAVNEALRLGQEAKEKELGKLSPGMGGMF